MNEKRAIITLRFALAVTFLYAGISSLLQPDLWIGWVPAWVNQLGAQVGLDQSLFLQIHGIIEILFGLSFLSGLLLRFFGVLAVLDLLAIVVMSALDGGLSAFLITFRDIGLIGATLALIFLSWDNTDDITS